MRYYVSQALLNFRRVNSWNFDGQFLQFMVMLYQFLILLNVSIDCNKAVKYLYNIVYNFY